MLAATEALSPAHAGSVFVDVASSPVRLALLFLAAEAGWRRCAHGDPCRCLLVADRIECRVRTVDVLVVRDDPASCQAGADAILGGQARALVLWDQPESLSVTLAAMASGVNAIPQRAIDLALAAPRVSDRQRLTLRYLASGLSSRAIAAAMHQSESTAKRDIAVLLELFRVDNRRALVAVASELGFVAGR